MTQALFAALQLASGDNHPVHYDVAVADLDDLRSDARFTTNAARVANFRGAPFARRRCSASTRARSCVKPGIRRSGLMG